MYNPFPTWPWGKMSKSQKEESNNKKIFIIYIYELLVYIET